MGTLPLWYQPNDLVLNSRVVGDEFLAADRDLDRLGFLQKLRLRDGTG